MVKLRLRYFKNKEATELYIANSGRFNVENFMGWNNLDILIDKNRIVSIPELNHSKFKL